MRGEGRKGENASVSRQVYYMIESECILISYFHSLDCKPQEKLPHHHCCLACE